MPLIIPAFNVWTVSKTPTIRDTKSSSKKHMVVVVTVEIKRHGKNKDSAPNTPEKP